MDVLCALLVFSFWSVAHTANPLRCYYCTNEDGKACFHPLNRSAIKTVNCGDLFYSEDKRQSGVRMESLEVIENYQKVGAGADFECFALVKNFSAGNAEVVRSCKIVEKKTDKTPITDRGYKCGSLQVLAHRASNETISRQNVVPRFRPHTPRNLGHFWVRIRTRLLPMPVHWSIKRN